MPVLMAFGLFGVVVGLAVFTNYRMSGYGRYDITYSKETAYTGPTWLSVLPIYYGYFPLSFNNLKINVMHQHVNHDYLGLYSFASLFFGLFQVDNVFGVDGAGQIANNLITNGSANVPTGFWDFYYDYGYLFFVPFIVALLILLFFMRHIKGKNGHTYKLLYCWYVVYFFFMSFQNTLFMSTSLVSGVIMFFVIKKSFKTKETSFFRTEFAFYSKKKTV